MSKSIRVLTPFVFFPIFFHPFPSLLYCFYLVLFYQRFRTKYHPREAATRQKELKKAMKRRLSVFLNLLKSGRADGLSLDIENTDAIMKLLDAGTVYSV